MIVIIGDKSKATAASATNLCASCRYYFAYKYALTDREVRLCTILTSGSFRLLGPVAECSDYRDKSAPYLDQIEKAAWNIEVSRRTAGFSGERIVKVVSPSERTDGEK